MNRQPTAQFNLRLSIYKNGGHTANKPTSYVLDNLRTSLRMYLYVPNGTVPQLEQVIGEPNRVVLSYVEKQYATYLKFIFVPPGGVIEPDAYSVRVSYQFKNGRLDNAKSSFSLSIARFVSRAYIEGTGYEPFTHHALPTQFLFYKKKDGTVEATMTQPLAAFAQEALQSRQHYPHLNVHLLPLKKAITESREAELAKEGGADVAAPEQVEERAAQDVKKKVEQTITAAHTPPNHLTPYVPPTQNEIVRPTRAPATRKPLTNGLMDEGSALFDITNEWLEKMQKHTTWVPHITTEQDEDGIVRLKLTLEHKRQP